ncbi:MAG: flagellar basal body rod protein [Hyphomonadaceae bacterium]
MERFTRASDELIDAVSGEGSADPAAALVEALEAKLQFEASVLVIHAWDDMMGALLDVRA